MLWNKVAAKYPAGSLTTVAESEEALRDAMKTFTTLRAHDLVRFKGSNKLFLGHRHGASKIDTGLGIRITVQYNLFGGSVANLGSPDQVRWLDEIFLRGEAGCFALTEARAGVLSGLIVDTTASVCPDDPQQLVLNSPPGAEKQWISNGLHARWAVVIARLNLAKGLDKDKGPHAFLVDLNANSGAGIIRKDMPSKVAFNSLDNCILSFDNVRIPSSSLLSGLSYLDTDGDYHLRDPEKPFSFIQVAQRLLSGRICIAGAALSVVKSVSEETRNYAEKRNIPTGKDSHLSLAELPVMRDLLSSIESRHSQLSKFLSILELKYLNNVEIDSNLVHLIACAKIECIRFGLSSYFALKMRVGAFAVLEKSPFGSIQNHETSLYCQRFAEGDCAVLEQKMARDCVKQYSKSPLLLLWQVLNIPIVLIR